MPIRSPAANRSPPLTVRPDNLVAWNERQLGLSQLSVHDVQVGAAHAAGRDCHEDLALGRLRVGQVGLTQRGARRVENHRTHG